MKSVNECKGILEAAIGECEQIIPSDVLESTIKYLDELLKLRNEKSWDMFPEAMGR